MARAALCAQNQPVSHNRSSDDTNSFFFGIGCCIGAWCSALACGCICPHIARIQRKDAWTDLWRGCLFLSGALGRHCYFSIRRLCAGASGGATGATRRTRRVVNYSRLEKSRKRIARHPQRLPGPTWKPWRFRVMAHGRRMTARQTPNGLWQRLLHRRRRLANHAGPRGQQGADGVAPRRRLLNRGVPCVRHDLKS